MMKDVVGLLIALLALPALWLPSISEAICLFRFPARRGRRGPSDQQPRLLFLIPAHDEELLIGQCVDALLAMEYPAGCRKVVVVADNCLDRTAEVSRQHGAECLERRQPDMPGKPHALAWALGQFDLGTFDAVVIVDADTAVATAFAKGLAEHAPLREQVLQASFMVLNEDETWLTRLGGLLSRCRYEVTYPLKARGGVNCPLTGNGMCLGTTVIREHGWRAFSIAEDSELYVQYTLAGVPIRHASSAVLYSQESSSLSQGATQRHRWLAGRLQALWRYGPALMRSRTIGLHQKLDLVVELVLSSPILHAAGACGVALLLWWLDPWGAGGPLALVSVSSLAGLVAVTLIAVVRHPHPAKVALAALFLPFYAGWRVLLFARTVLTVNDTRWQRTTRSPAGPPTE